MSRIFTVLSVPLLVLGLAPLAFGMNYHIIKEHRPSDSSNQYYWFFATPNQAEASWVLPSVLGNDNDPDTRLILHTDDTTASNTGYGSEPRIIGTRQGYALVPLLGYQDSVNGPGIGSLGNVTVQSNDPSITRRLSATDTSLFVINSNEYFYVYNPNDGYSYWRDNSFYRYWDDPLRIAFVNAATLTIKSDVLISGSTNTLGVWGGVIQNGYASGSTQNLGFQAGVPFLSPGTVLVQPGVLTITDENGSSIDYDIIDVYTFAVSSTLNAEGVTFSNNELAYGGVVVSSGRYDEWQPAVAADGNIYVFHDTGIAFNNLNRAVFSNNSNSTGPGGAIQSYAWSLTEANNARFTQNQAADVGGAIHAYQSILYAQGSDTLFSENRSGGAGGAISAYDSALYLKGANFRHNTAQGIGGAILFAIDDGFRYDITVGAYANTTAEFVHNEDSGGANSIAFFGTGTAFLLVDTDLNATLNMVDPMRVWTGSNLGVEIEKVGEGKWSLGGISDMREAAFGTRAIIREGTFQLNGGAELNLRNANGWDFLRFDSGTTFAVGIAGNPGTAATIATTSLMLAQGTTMRLNDDLILNLSGADSTIASTLSGSGNLTKNGAGTLTFAGTSNNYMGDVAVRQGTFAVAAGKQFTTLGRFDILSGATLSVVADATRPTIVASEVDMRGALVEISGVSGNADDEYVIIRSSNSIRHNSNLVPPTFNNSSNVDYLSAVFGFRDVGSVRDAEYVGTIRLSWYNTGSADPNMPHGNFDVRTASGGIDFTVGSVLRDVISKNPNWTGKDLTKDGKGTLELSEDNTYSGTTTIKHGTLLLTHANATGNGNSAIQVESLGTLALDLQHGRERSYGRQISGDGKVLKQGDSTVKLTNIANNYKGGTEIQGGILQFDDDRVFGTGTMAFTGGTLQNTSATTLTQHITVAQDNVARFDTLHDLTVDGGITGPGGLAKTGVGTLTLTGTNPYQGETRFEEGIVAISRWDNIGLGELVFDGGALNNDGSDVVLSNDVRLEKDGIFGGGANSNLTLTGMVYGDYSLLNIGDESSTLTLSGVNSYTGGTKINSGTVAIGNRESLGSGPVIFAGGTLKNTKEIVGFSRELRINPGVMATFEIDENDMSIASKIVGDGGLVKTGNAVLTLAGENTYTGETIVREGVLAVDGRINSNVTVEQGAALSGTGTVNRNVTFQEGSIYRWDFHRTEDDSPHLHIAGDVFLQDAYFQPVTAGDTSTYPIDVEDWTILKYDGRLLGDGRFYVDDSLCPFIDIALDYDTNGQVRLVAHNRYDPRPLSDVMAAGLLMAQRKANRRAFEQVDNELRNGRYLGATPIPVRNLRGNAETRGQVRNSAKYLWGGLVSRTSNIASTYHTQDQWRLNSFGVQAGYSFLSTNWISLGVTAGADFPQLKNKSDKIDGSGGHLGLYYGQRVLGVWELKGFLGGGLQSYKLYRRDAKYLYRADYHGDSFQVNAELARPVLLGDWMLRPYIGLDMEYVSQAGAVESESSAEFRTYSGTSLTQTFLRLGLDFEKRFERGDFLFGIGYANMIGGQSVPNVYVYYPFAKKGVTSYGAEMGHNVVSLSLGGKRYINQARTKTLFIDYTAEIFCDRAGGASQHNFGIGFSSRF